jgi:hypothetical protein
VINGLDRLPPSSTCGAVCWNWSKLVIIVLAVAVLPLLGIGGVPLIERNASQ